MRTADKQAGRQSKYNINILQISLRMPQKYSLTLHQILPFTHTHTHIYAILWHLKVHIMCVFQNLCNLLGELVHIYRIAYVLAPLVLNLGTRRKEVCSFTILPLCLRGLTSSHWVAGWVHPTVLISPSQKKQISSPCRELNHYPTRNHVTHMCIFKRVPWDFALNMHLHVDKFLKKPNHKIGLCRNEEGYCNLNKHCQNVHLFLSSLVM